MLALVFCSPWWKLIFCFQPDSNWTLSSRVHGHNILNGIILNGLCWTSKPRLGTRLSLHARTHYNKLELIIFEVASLSPFSEGSRLVSRLVGTEIAGPWYQNKEAVLPD